MKIIEFGQDGSRHETTRSPGKGERMKILEFGDSGGGARPRSESTRSAEGSSGPAGRWEPAPRGGGSLVEPVRPKSLPARRSASRSLRMHVLDLGKLRLDKNFMVANSTVAMARNPNPPGQLIDIPVSAYYIEHPDGNVLFDTGCHPDWGGPDGRWPEGIQDVFPVIGGEDCYLPHRLEAMGIGPNQIRHVVLSHLHCDHAGCIEYFRKSNIIVHEDEFAAAALHYVKRIHTTPYALKDIEAWMRLDLNWREVGRHDPDRNIVEGVKLLNFGAGHSYGMLGLQVALRDHADVILASDACYTSENYGPPMKPPGISHDSIGFARTIQRIRALAEDCGAEVWFGHDIPQFDSLRKADEGWYE
ncbi:Glyoxylase, beta-lactamase superfamily II [Tistlia consotensis]|uniref:Glyoxylase, beta-lactamase superfamily II n=1 Tax=Tistlia consotensis USBA 355 TaxID=560819 RepID=A0A1Y6BUC0_9PROT|nr:N-acyl homoserine lactonase family protein [Tistlia consotensis]SMF29226.1 Glyoxylase, beta-lactamase superfamily II [Tistlia consotensis USBA 355]SNR91488.1 Glyoxylase, beta-lactamase superfamily II [Tistlia consotensis]